MKERSAFNELVVKLVQYIQKRDVRYQKFKLQEAKEKEEKRLK